MGRKLEILLVLGLALLSLSPGSGAPGSRDDIVFIQAGALPLELSGGGGFGPLTKADFNGDGNLDVAAAYSTNVAGVGDRGFVSVLLGDGKGAFTPGQRLVFPESPRASFPSGLTARDFDGDGRPDLAVSNPQLKTVHCYKGAADGTFGAAIMSTSGGSTGALHGFRLDGDAHWDLVGVNHEEGTVGVLLGNGDCSFKAPVLHMIGRVVDAAIADMNGDGRADIVAGTYDQRTVAILLNDGTGMFTASSFNVGGEVTGLYVADFDGDEKRDVIVSVNAGPKFFAFAMIKGNGDGTLQPAPPGDSWVGLEGYPSRGGGDNVAPDLDGDGMPEVVFFGRSNYVSVGRRAATGQWQTSEWVSDPQASGEPPRVDLTYPSGLLFDDFNGDGALDMLVASRANQRSGTLAFLPGDPVTKGSFRSPRIYKSSRSWAQTRRATALADLDNNGDLDLIVLSDALDMLPGDGKGSFGAAVPVMGHVSGPGEAYTAMTVADFDKDGSVDVAWLGTNGVQGGPKQRVLVSFGNGSGGLEGPAVFAMRDNGSGCHGGGDIALADFNGDGFQDFAVWVDNGCGNNAWIDVYLYDPVQKRSFTLAPASLDISPTGFFPSANLLAGDLDGDGKADVVTRTGPGGEQPERVQLFRGEGDGSFQPPTRLPGELPEIVHWASADLNHDAIADLVAFGGLSAHVMLGLGKGIFLPARAHSAGNIAQSGAIADIDGDGELDIVFAAHDSGVTVVRGFGDGSFAPPKPLAVGSQTSWTVNVGDLNRDGRPELVIGHKGDALNHFTVLVNASQNQPPPPFSIQRVSPARAGDTGPITLRLRGRGFSAGAKVKLVRATDAIEAMTVDVNTVGAIADAQLKLSAAARGMWDVVLTNPDGSAATLTGAVTIEAARGPELWADLLGRRIVRVGAAQRYTVAFGNRGNTDGGGILYLTGLPAGAVVEPLFQRVSSQLPPALEEVAGKDVVFDTAAGKAFSVLLPPLPPDFTGSVDLNITASSPVTTNLTLTVLGR